MYITFDIDAPVVGVKDNAVYLKGSKDFKEKIYVVLNMDMHRMIQSEILEKKADYCSRYDHFCGVGIVAVEAIKADETNTMFNYETEEMDIVEQYVVVSFTVDMEHG